MSEPHAPAPPAGDDEPTTPMWLPVVGLTLLVAVGIAWALIERPFQPFGEASGAPAAASASASSPGLR